MKLIYTGRTTTDAHLFAALLAEQGIAAEVRGEPMWISEEPRLSRRPPVTTVWVSDEDAERGSMLANEHASQMTSSEAAGWTCADCGETNPGQFDECWNCGAMPPGYSASDRSPVEMPVCLASDVQISVVSGDGVASEGSMGEASRNDAPERVPKADEPDEPWTRRPVPWTFPWGLTLITTICVLIWHGLSSEPNPLADPAMEHWGWRSAHDVWGGAWWSLLTSSFVHAEWDHLEGNILWLWIFGFRLEQALGTGRFLMFMVASAILSGAVDQAWLGEHSFGASGMLSAVYGLFVVAGTTYRLMPMWFYIPLCLYFAEGTLFDIADVVQEMAGQEVVDPVANVCHLTGLAFGALTGLAFIERWKPRICALGFGAMTVLAVLPLMWAQWLYDWCLDRAKFAKSRAILSNDADAEKEAVAWCDRAIRLKPDDAIGWIDRGELHLLANRYDAALADANAAVAIEEALLRKVAEDKIEALKELLESDSGRGDEAARKSSDGNPETHEDGPASTTPGKEGVKDNSSEPPAPDASPEPGRVSSKITGLSLLLRGRIHLALGRYAEAESDLNRAVIASTLSSNDNPFARVVLATLLFDLSRHDEALKELRRASKTAPNDPVVLAVRGAVLRDYSEPSAARDELKRATDGLWGPGVPSTFDYESLVLLAWMFDELDEPHEAEDFATLALGHIPHDVDTLARRGHARMRLEKYDEALADADAALAINPRSVFAHCVRGLTLMQLDRIDDAEQSFQRAVAINPRYLMALRGRAAVRFAQGRRSAALEDLNRAIQLNPRCALAYIERSQVHAALGNTAESEADKKLGDVLDIGAEVTEAVNR